MTIALSSALEAWVIWIDQKVIKLSQLLHIHELCLFYRLIFSSYFLPKGLGFDSESLSVLVTDKTKDRLNQKPCQNCYNAYVVGFCVAAAVS